MSFNIEVYVLNLKKGGGSWMLYDILSVGLWDGKEITNAKDCPSGVITDISTQFEQMTKAKPDKPKPLSITWEPSKENKMLFVSTLRNATVELRFSVKQKDGTNSWGFTFGEVKIFKTSKKNKIERVHASFIKFHFDSY